MSTPAADRFEGFPAAAFAFYRGLEADNSKPFWTANQQTYLEEVRAPIAALTTELADEFGLFQLFRPHRDVRFSKDKTPYKTSQGAVTEGEGGELYYLNLSSTGVFAGSGMYRMASDQLDRFRRAVDAEATGTALVEIVAGLERRYTIGEPDLKVAPRGFPRDHPRIRFLRHKGITVGRQLPIAPAIHTRRAARTITDTWRGAAPLHEWLATHVGPSTLAPDEGR